MAHFNGAKPQFPEVSHVQRAFVSPCIHLIYRWAKDAGEGTVERDNSSPRTCAAFEGLEEGKGCTPSCKTQVSANRRSKLSGLNQLQFKHTTDSSPGGSGT